MATHNETTPGGPGALLNPKAAAAFLGLSEWTLAEWRCRGGGPRYIKAGNRVRYAPAALQAWIEGNTCTSTSDDLAPGR
jgi:hypothetical protein